jgi:hypothetical protein
MNNMTEDKPLVRIDGYRCVWLYTAIWSKSDMISMGDILLFETYLTPVLL